MLVPGVTVLLFVLNVRQQTAIAVLDLFLDSIVCAKTQFQADLQVVLVRMIILVQYRVHNTHLVLFQIVRTVRMEHVLIKSHGRIYVIIHQGVVMLVKPVVGMVAMVA